jgi:hypothetical protein
VAVGAPADRFSAFQYNLDKSSSGGDGALGEDLGRRRRLDLIFSSWQLSSPAGACES